MLVQTYVIHGPDDAYQAITLSLSDCALSLFGVQRVGAGALRVGVVDARTRSVLVECRIDPDSENTELLLVAMRVAGTSPVAFAIYSVEPSKLSLAAAWSGEDPAVPRLEQVYPPGFERVRWRSGEFIPPGPHTALRCWSLNGGGSDGVASVLYVQGNAEGHNWNGTFEADVETLKRHSLKDWPQPVWILVLSRD